MDVYKCIFFSICIRMAVSKLRDFSNCHDDINLKPQDGVLEPHAFKWLGFVYYIHVTTSLPHQSVAPRVVLIHKHFVLGTAAGLLKLPKTIDCNVTFGDYERDEDECNLSFKEIKMAQTCARAYFVMPIQEIIPHPEFTRFGLGNSLAVVKLVRPIKSFYMVPICLPSLKERRSRRKDRRVFMIDYLSPVPLDIDAERMAKKTLKMFSHRDCARFQKREFESEIISHELCTTGCGVRRGVPIITQDSDGPFQLIGLAASSEPCTKQRMRSRLNDDPPLFIDVYPYITWIMNVVAASIIPRPYAGSFMLVEGGSNIGIRKGFLRQPKKQKYGWKGRTFVSGNYCYMNPKRQERTAFFYSEYFSVISTESSNVDVFVKISAGVECTITCARLVVPNHKSTPIIDGVGGFNVSVQLDADYFPYRFFFTLGLNGKNASKELIGERWAQRGVGW